MTGPIPPVVRSTGVVVMLEGLVALVCAVVVVFSGGDDARVTYGTAGMFVLLGAAVSGAGWALWNGRRWGRGVAVFTQLLLLPVAWYFVTSGRLEFGVPLGIVAILTLVSLFSAPTLRWAAYQEDSASSDSAEPDTR